MTESKIKKAVYAELKKEGYIKPSISGCLEWTLSKNTKRGYGRKSIKGKRKLAHRYVYELICGNIPEGKQLDHLCRNKMCVNVDHLEIVNNQENCRRRSSTKLNQIKADTIRFIYKNYDITQKNIAKMYNIKRCTVTAICNNRLWI